jgi:hypothetical protein
MALLWTGMVDDIGPLFAIEHVVMLPSMLLVMLLRREEYTGAARQNGRFKTRALPQSR